MMFGATSAVHAWDLIGAFILHLARVMLHMPVLRYVDDYFSAERSDTVRHAMEMFARLVRALLGSSSISNRKLLYGNPLEVLGLDVHISSFSIEIWPNEVKRLKWLKRIQDALDSGVLRGGEASRCLFPTQFTPTCLSFPGD